MWTGAGTQHLPSVDKVFASVPALYHQHMAVHTSNVTQHLKTTLSYIL